MSTHRTGEGILAAVFFALVLILPAAGAGQQNFYQWVDKQGTVHFTDNYYAIPPQYRSQVKEVPGGAPPPPPSPSTPAPGGKAGPAPAAPSPGAAGSKKGAVQGATLYGEQTAAEWKKSFSDLRKGIQQLQTGLAQKKAYIQAVDSGRRLGSTYDAQQINLYDRYTKEIPADEAKLTDLQSQLAELERKARYFGVPRKIREE